ncbi:hypothetical protein LEP1GSC192_2191 [Leptospira sp. B5-022]|nr:hypothetical protein LEP1GSC192_2191 [Leptospira sp. B5-022]
MVDFPKLFDFSASLWACQRENPQVSFQIIGTKIFFFKEGTLPEER